LEVVAAHPLACALLPPCFSGRRGTTWCRYASTSRWTASATGRPSPGTREVTIHPAPLSLPLLAAFDSLSCCSGRRSLLGDHQLRQEDGQGPQAVGHVRPPMLQSIQVPLSLVPPSLLGFTAFLLIYFFFRETAFLPHPSLEAGAGRGLEPPPARAPGNAAQGEDCASQGYLCFSA
jgi:hypothetical protein